MDNKNKLEKESISKAQYEDCNRNIDNDDIEVISEDIPYEVVSLGDDFAVTYGPDPRLNAEFFVDIDSDMYGGPLPEDFYRDDTNIPYLDQNIEFSCDDDIESVKESGEKNPN